MDQGGFTPRGYLFVLPSMTQLLSSRNVSPTFEECQAWGSRIGDGWVQFVRDSW